MIGVLVVYCGLFQYCYGKRICEEYKRMMELSRNSSRTARVVPIQTPPGSVVRGIMVENIPENSVIITLNV